MYFFDSDVCIEIMRGHLLRAQEIMRKSSPDLFGVPGYRRGRAAVRGREQ